ncbi:MAG TPA: cytidine deaminase, partial [Chthoniobacterales bacterium]|nr:cytidine deaminase [Chthoniobacterales bacterium]
MGDQVEWEPLMARAVSVRENAYAPYSKFKVGAALLSEGGAVFVGCNVENVSFGLTICAERAALLAAVAAGSRKFVALALT